MSNERKASCFEWQKFVFISCYANYLVWIKRAWILGKDLEL